MELPSMKDLIRQEIYRILDLMEEIQFDSPDLWNWIEFFTRKLERC